MKDRLSRNILLLFPILLAILLMGIGYASINSITGEIKGTVIAEVQSGVFITNIMLEINISVQEADIENYSAYPPPEYLCRISPEDMFLHTQQADSGHTAGAPEKRPARLPPDGGHGAHRPQIGRASCRERV